VVFALELHSHLACNCYDVYRESSPTPTLISSPDPVLPFLTPNPLTVHASHAQYGQGLSVLSLPAQGCLFCCLKLEVCNSPTTAILISDQATYTPARAGAWSSLLQL
jgi:hypothetical protein